MAVVSLLNDDEASVEALAVFNDIRQARGTDYVNNFWRALAHDPGQLKSVWDRIQSVMGPGALDPLVKELIYVAVSTANGCGYCVHSHTASARAKGMTPAMHAELMAVIAMASQTNALATALGVPVDARFDTEETKG
nr:carboxymuconolactone decarboxylase family protein [Rhizobium sp. TCK]